MVPLSHSGPTSNLQAISQARKLSLVQWQDLNTFAFSSHLLPWLMQQKTKDANKDKLTVLWRLIWKSSFPVFPDGTSSLTYYSVSLGFLSLSKKSKTHLPLLCCPTLEKKPHLRMFDMNCFKLGQCRAQVSQTRAWS